MLEKMRDFSDAVLHLGELVLRFGKTMRATLHPDGTPESDTTHTVMLGLLACAYAKETAPHLDRGLIAQFSLVHDLVEAYAGDTQTLKHMSAADAHEKVEREQAALTRIKMEFGAPFPWIHETIEAYESLASPEARFVKTMDKTLPGITHILNAGSAHRLHGHTQEWLKTLRETQRSSLAAGYAGDQGAALRLWDEVIKRESEISL